MDKFLKIGGVLLLEIGFDQKEAILDICKNSLNKYSVEIYKDINGNDRIAVIKLM